MTSLHAPERQPGESFDQYRKRRAASHRAVRMVRKLLVYRPSAERTNRRATVKLEGGIRQFKRMQYRAKGWL